MPHGDEMCTLSFLYFLLSRKASVSLYFTADLGLCRILTANYVEQRIGHTDGCRLRRQLYLLKLCSLSWKGRLPVFQRRTLCMCHHRDITYLPVITASTVSRQTGLAGELRRFIGYSSVPRLFAAWEACEDRASHSSVGQPRGRNR